MIDRRHTIPKGEDRKGTFGLEPKQSSAKGISDQDVEKGGERTSLPYPTRGFKELCRSSIYKRGYPGRCNACLNLFDENQREPKLAKNQENKFMPQPVKCIGQIQFYSHSRITPFGAGVDGLLNQKDIITNFPAQDKAPLIWRDKRGDDLLEP